MKGWDSLNTQLNQTMCTNLQCRESIKKKHSLHVNTVSGKYLYIFIHMLSWSIQSSMAGWRIHIIPGTPAHLFGWRAMWKQRSVTHPISNAELKNFSVGFHFRPLVSWVLFFHREPRLKDTREAWNKRPIECRVTMTVWYLCHNTCLYHERGSRGDIHHTDTFSNTLKKINLFGISTQVTSSVWKNGVKESETFPADNNSFHIPTPLLGRAGWIIQMWFKFWFGPPTTMNDHCA